MPPGLQLQRWLLKPDKAESLADGGGGYVTTCAVAFSFLCALAWSCGEKDGAQSRRRKPNTDSSCRELFADWLDGNGYSGRGRAGGRAGETDAERCRDRSI